MIKVFGSTVDFDLFSWVCVCVFLFAFAGGAADREQSSNFVFASDADYHLLDARSSKPHVSFGEKVFIWCMQHMLCTATDIPKTYTLHLEYNTVSEWYCMVTSMTERSTEMYSRSVCVYYAHKVSHSFGESQYTNANATIALRSLRPKIMKSWNERFCFSRRNRWGSE